MLYTCPHLPRESELVRGNLMGCWQGEPNWICSSMHFVQVQGSRSMTLSHFCIFLSKLCYALFSHSGGAGCGCVKLEVYSIPPAAATIAAAVVCILFDR